MSPTSYQTAPPRSNGRYSIKLLHFGQANIVVIIQIYIIHPTYITLKNELICTWIKTFKYQLTNIMFSLLLVIDKPGKIYTIIMYEIIGNLQGQLAVHFFFNSDDKTQH